MMRGVLLGLLTLSGAGCSAEGDKKLADVTTTASSVTTAGPTAFVAEARAMTFGNKDLAAASNGDLLRLGRVVCDGLASRTWASAESFRGLFGRRHADGHRSQGLRQESAVRNLCTQHASAIR